MKNKLFIFVSIILVLIIVILGIQCTLKNNYIIAREEYDKNSDVFVTITILYVFKNDKCVNELVSMKFEDIDGFKIMYDSIVIAESDKEVEITQNSEEELILQYRTKRHKNNTMQDIKENLKNTKWQIIEF